MSRSHCGDRGETLIELVVAIAVLGICVVAVASSMVLSIKVSGIHRSQAELDRVLHNYAERLESSYLPCDQSGTYSLPQQTGFNVPTISVTYWNGSAFGSSCPSTGDAGLQKVQVSVGSSDNQASDSISVVLRQP